jgi:signal transduction histidine kinase
MATHEHLDVLLIEDNPGDARLISEMLLESSGVRVRLQHVAHLAVGLERLAQTEPDVALVDLDLPDSHGLETVLRLRSVAPRMPVVVLSGQTDATLALRAVRAGAQDYLLKGHVDGEVLVRALRYAIEHKRIEERQRFLAEASRALADSLEYEATLRCASDLPVPLLADACVVTRLPNRASPGYLVARDVEAGREARLRQASEPLVSQAPTALSQTQLPRALAGLGFVACASVPLAANGRTFGAMWLLRSAVRPAFGREDVETIEELARRSALAVENARLHHELQEAVRLRDEVLAATSHDLRSPLSGIQLQAKVLRRQLGDVPGTADPALHARLVRGLDEIDTVVTRSLGLIQELLDAACLQAGRHLPLERRPTDLADLARRVVADHQARTEFHTIELQPADAPVIGEWDPPRLARVLDNLVSNARKYSLGGGTISVAVRRESDADGEWGLVRVQDGGVGIPAAELGRVFDRFYRGSNVHEHVRGTGIGLAGARQIVEQHGGSIEVDSQEGVGSSFTVRLPLAARPSLQ